MTLFYQFMWYFKILLLEELPLITELTAYKSKSKAISWQSYTVLTKEH